MCLAIILRRDERMMPRQITFVFFSVLLSVEFNQYLNQFRLVRILQQAESIRQLTISLSPR